MSSNGQTCSVSLTGSAADSFLFLINTLMASQCLFDTKSQYNIYKLQHKERFDYIVVGAGSAGAVAASRLAENPNLKVLLLEAGGIPEPNTEIPAFTLQNLFTQMNWYDEMEPSNNCKGIRNGRCFYSRGKGLGGSSSINGMVYVRGNQRDFEEWVEAGNENWDWTTVKQYFKKSENLQAESLKYNSDYGTDGPLTITLPEGDKDVSSLVFKVAKELNQNVSKDAVFKGYYEALSTIRNGRRCSTAKAFLSNDKQRNNLFIATNAFVERLIIDKASMTAKGVVVTIKDRTISVFATKEVILSAGVIGSPIILQKSRIGPTDFIKDPILNLPVGKNFHDHVAVLNFLVKIQDKKLSNRPPIDMLEVLYKYFSKQEGPLSSLGTINLLGFINTQNTTSEYPNIQFHHVYVPKGDTTVQSFLDAYNVSPDFKTDILKSVQNTDVLFIVPVLIKPKSRGEVKFRPNSDKPYIQANFLDHVEDVRSLLEAINYIEKFINTETMRDRKANLLDFNHPCKKENKIDWLCFLKYFSVSAVHGVGTCKMAKKELGGVVDSKLRVYGMKNLRVADSSIIPVVTSGNTNIPTIMIGERVADFILQDLNK